MSIGGGIESVDDAQLHPVAQTGSHVGTSADGSEAEYPAVAILSGSDEPDLDSLIELYRSMLTIRRFEENVFDLYGRAEIVGIAHVSIGQEAVPVGVCSSLMQADYVTSTHRGHGHCIAKGADLTKMFAELLGRVGGYCGGKGGSMHVADVESGNLGANAIVGGSLGIATGAALSAKTRRSGQVVACFFGDGAVNQGLLLETLNLAGLWNLPCIYVCENNQYCEYIASSKVTSGSIVDRGAAFGIPTVAVDGMNVLDVRRAANWAAARCRRGEGPAMLVCETYRFYGHGMSDRDRPYRTREEEAAWRARDPLAGLARYVNETYQVDVHQLPIDSEVSAEVAEARRSALLQPYPDPAEVATNVYRS
jgi:TPP-dependent pyruvate/acetoin dehydrogenase alpha subunit